MLSRTEILYETLRDMKSKHTLRYPSILHSRFIHLYGIILQVEEYDAPSDAVLFLMFLVDCLLEVGIETQYLDHKLTMNILCQKYLCGIHCSTKLHK